MFLLGEGTFVYKACASIVPMPLSFSANFLLDLQGEEQYGPTLSFSEALRLAVLKIRRSTYVGNRCGVFSWLLPCLNGFRFGAREEGRYFEVPKSYSLQLLIRILGILIPLSSYNVVLFIATKVCDISAVQDDLTTGHKKSPPVIKNLRLQRKSLLS